MQIRPSFTTLLVLLLASTATLRSTTAQEATASSDLLTPCPPLPQPLLTTAPTPCPTTPQPSPAVSSNAIAAESDGAAVVTETPAPTAVPTPTPTIAPSPVVAVAIGAPRPEAEVASTPGSEAPVFSCTPVSVKGDATYCISGRVCSGTGSSLPGTNCPKKGDVAIAHCWSYLKSYNGAGDKCVAPQDAQCVVIETGAWGCVFPDAGVAGAVTPAPTTTALSTAASTPTVATTALAAAQPAPEVAEVASDADTPPTNGDASEQIQVEIASPQTTWVRVDSAAAQGVAQASYTVSASAAAGATLFATQSGADSSASAQKPSGGGAGLNAGVAVAAMVVAVFGVVVAKKRQRDRLETQHDSSRNLGCMELSTPL